MSQSNVHAILSQQAVKWILISNLIVFPTGFLFGANWPALGLVPAAFSWKLAHGHLLSALADLVRYQFFHANLPHLFWNMFFFIVSGLALAYTLGTKRFLSLYLVSGIVSGLAFVMFASVAAIPIIDGSGQVETTTAYLPMIGASGSIAGIMGAALVLTREQPLVQFSYLDLAIKLKHILVFWVGWQAYLLYSALAGLSFQSGEFVLHLSGFAFGYAASSLWKSQFESHAATDNSGKTD